MNRSDFELMAPVGSRDSLAAALRAGADSVYFGVERLNMRARSSACFTLEDLRDIARECHTFGVKAYLTLNTVIYDSDLPLMREIVRTAVEAGIDAVIASDVAVMRCCREQGMEVHLSTQLNVSNTEALLFYSRFADVVVLARELALPQVKAIHEAILAQGILGPGGKPVRIEMFCHGALCMAVSGKCYLSLGTMGSSANRGECLQVCRRRYTVRDKETGTELDIENEHVMSPKDLKTIGFLDRMMDAGVRVFKIEGRARGPEYVDTVTRCYREAITSVVEGTYCEAKVRDWDEQLSRVFNRGFWDGYYLGQRLGEWAEKHGSQATERKVYCGKVVRHFARIGVGEFKIEATTLRVGDNVIITGPTTGVVRTRVEELRYDLHPIAEARQGWNVSFPVPVKVRRGDKLFVLEATV